jgi:hypothetical protein
MERSHRRQWLFWFVALLGMAAFGGCKSCGTSPPCGAICIAPAEHVCINQCRRPLDVGDVCNPKTPCASGLCPHGSSCLPVFSTGATEYRCLTFVPGAVGDRCVSSPDSCEQELYCNSRAVCPEFSLKSPACASPAGVGSQCDSDISEVHDPGKPHCKPCELGAHCVDGFCHAACEPRLRGKDCPCDHCIAGHCNDRLTCKATPNGSLCYRCVGLGEACNSNIACCDSTKLDCGPGGTCCTVDGASGCSSTADCCDQVGHRCIGSTCAPCRKVREACSSKADCCSGLVCYSGACDTCHKEGAACISKDDCCSGAQCISGKCLAPDGATCPSSLATLCASGVCTCGICGRGLPPGSSCVGYYPSVRDCLCRAGDKTTHCGEGGRCRHFSGCSPCVDDQSCPAIMTYLCDYNAADPKHTKYCCGANGSPGAPCTKHEDCCQGDACDAGHCKAKTGCKHFFCGYSGSGGATGCDPPSSDPCADDPSKCACQPKGRSCNGPFDPPCCAPYRCGYAAGAAGTVCTTCANAGDPCFIDGPNCCAADSSGVSPGDCAYSFSARAFVCTSGPDECAGPGDQCQFIGEIGPTCCFDDATHTKRNPCPDSGYCP